MCEEEPEVGELIRRIGLGDEDALGQLLTRHRARLRRMVGFRMDPRLKGRIDPSDVVQEALMTASRKIDEFLRDRPLPFYPWLRQLAWNRLLDIHRTHVRTQKRSVQNEEPWSSSLLNRSAMRLAGRLTSGGTSPSAGAIRREVRDRVRCALEKLAAADREILVLRYLEELSVSEIAAVVGLTEVATRKRQFRALERLQVQLGDSFNS